MSGVGFHPEARLEFADGIAYYAREASSRVAGAFVNTVDSAILDIAESPSRWPIVEQPDIRRYLVRRFRYVLYYRWDGNQEQVTIYAVMHCSRMPGYWKHRIA